MHWEKKQNMSHKDSPPTNEDKLGVPPFNPCYHFVHYIRIILYFHPTSYQKTPQIVDGNCSNFIPMILSILLFVTNLVLEFIEKQLLFLLMSSHEIFS